MWNGVWAELEMAEMENNERNIWLMLKIYEICAQYMKIMKYVMKM